MRSETAWFERLIMLRSFPGMQHMATNDLAAWAEHTVEVRFKRGDIIHEEGKPVRYVYLVISGSAELRLDGKPFRRLHDHGTLGAFACFARLENGQTTVALSDIVALRIEFNTMLDLFEDNFVIFRGVFLGMATDALESRKALGSHAGFSRELSPQPDDLFEEDLNLVERMSLLKTGITFVRSKLDPIAEIAADAETVRYKKGEVLWREGDRLDYSIAIIRGVVRCESEASDQTFRLGPQDSVGALDSAAVQPRWCTVTVEEDLVGLRISAQTYLDIFEDYFHFALDLLEMLAHAIISFHQQRYSIDNPDAVSASP